MNRSKVRAGTDGRTDGQFQRIKGFSPLNKYIGHKDLSRTSEWIKFEDFIEPREILNAVWILDNLRNPLQFQFVVCKHLFKHSSNKNKNYISVLDARLEYTVSQ